ncbi:hypothetical protein SpCBS45565_g03597 [Spizellomyces sp. 'palustris']
MYDT